MVLRLCRQILRGEEDAEDAAQATFLVLARRAGSISRRESVSCWLHGVALWVAAKARVAATRRRKYELRGGEMRTAGHVIDAELEALENHEDWATLLDELGGLPRSFREPLILCYLDGLTQEQAATQLRCPLGTIQSRLARGRAKLKARLEKRGVGLSGVFGGANHVALQSCPAPQVWAETTVRLAMEFTQCEGHATAGAGTASVLLAEESVCAIVVNKLNVAAIVILVAGVALSGAGAWATHHRKTRATVLANNLGSPARNSEPNVVQEKAAAPARFDTRTIRGSVRDQQGKPIAGAYIVLPPSLGNGRSESDTLGRFDFAAPVLSRTNTIGVQVWAFKAGLAVASVQHNITGPHEIVLASPSREPYGSREPTANPSPARVEPGWIFFVDGPGNSQIPRSLATPLAVSTGPDGTATIAYLRGPDLLRTARVSAEPIGEQDLAVSDDRREAHSGATS